jgi:hypothetical protein
MGSLLVGCSSSLNDNGELTSGLRPPAPKAASVTALPPNLQPRNVTGFRGPMIIIFSAQDSHNGERIPTATITLPLKAQQVPGHPERLEIMTVYGPRWIATSEVMVEPTP